MNILKKVFAFTVALAIAASMLAVLSFAAEIKTPEEYALDIYGHWDSLFVDGEDIAAGGAIKWIIDHDGNVEVHASRFMVRGWLASSYKIEQFGYVINDAEPVFSDTYTAEAEQAVYDAAAQYELDYATRYEISFDTAGLPSEFLVKFVVKLDNGEIVELPSPNIDGVEFYYSDPEAQHDEPTATPEGQSEEPTPASALENKSIDEIRFNSYEKVEDFFMYSPNNAHVGAIEYDEEKNCCVMSIMAGEDPNVVLPFGQLLLDTDVDYFSNISADTCKAAVFIASLDYDNVLNSDQKVEGTFYYQSEGGSTYSESKNLHYNYEETDAIQCIILNFERARTWKGEIQDCRFDMVWGCDNDIEYNLYYFGFFASVADAEEFVALYKEKGDDAMKKEPETPTPAPATATPEPLATDVPATEAPKTDNPTEAPATEKPAEKKGCGSVIGGTVFAFASMLTAAFVLAKRKKA